MWRRWFVQPPFSPSPALYRVATYSGLWFLGCVFCVFDWFMLFCFNRMSLMLPQLIRRLRKTRKRHRIINRFHRIYGQPRVSDLLAVVTIFFLFAACLNWIRCGCTLLTCVLLFRSGSFVILCYRMMEHMSTYNFKQS